MPQDYSPTFNFYLPTVQSPEEICLYLSLAASLLQKAKNQWTQLIAGPLSSSLKFPNVLKFFFEYFFQFLPGTTHLKSSQIETNFCFFKYYICYVQEPERYILFAPFSVLQIISPSFSFKNFRYFEVDTMKFILPNNSPCNGHQMTPLCTDNYHLILLFLTLLLSLVTSVSV